jgi:hypothetical protein
MPLRKHAIHDLIDDLTSSLNGNLAEPVSRRVRYALALLHATVESLEEIDRSGLPLLRRHGSVTLRGEP